MALASARLGSSVFRSLPAAAATYSSSLCPGAAVSPVVWSCGNRCQVRSAALGGHALTNRSACKTRLPHIVPMSASYTTSAPHEDVEGEFSLAKKKCVPCSSKELRPMTEEAARTLLSQIPDWELLELDGKLQLQRRWKSKNFVKGLQLFTCIADIAEAEGHHPDLHLVGWNNLTVNIFTHSIGGLTENDFILAAKISSLDYKDLMRKTVPKAAPTGT